MNNAFEGIINLFEPENFTKIQSAHFLVVGIGGVGSWVCEALARSGALNVAVVDLDEICESNINRQVHALSTNIGKTKVEEIKKRMLAINSSINVNCIADFFTESTKEFVFANQFDFIFDAIDSYKNKSLLIHECTQRKIPFISIGATGARLDPTLIEIRDINRTINDKLLQHVKRYLKKNYGFYKFHKDPYKVPTVTSTELPKKMQESSSTTGINCQSGLGSASFVTASFGFAAVAYALKRIAHE
ncbi:MAG: tRNA threonylcarbamoyladenosine dehydratase [Halobacteriovoraceae bacterium]|jgi:tRNA threonylcarbamoyladenosine dehydratase|nr:tRNA threonylcarbamoyladenosine dehydratase [Halobacteriovoraceae bacterium]